MEQFDVIFRKQYKQRNRAEALMAIYLNHWLKIKIESSKLGTQGYQFLESQELEESIENLRALAIQKSKSFKNSGLGELIITDIRTHAINCSKNASPKRMFSIIPKGRKIPTYEISEKI